MTARLTDVQVVAIRTSSLTDSWWSDKLRVRLATVRNARIGLSHKHVPALPDTAPRDQTGCTHAMRQGLPQKAVPRKQRRAWSWE